MARHAETTQSDDELDLESIPPSRRAAAKTVDRADRFLGRLVYWRIAAVLFLGSLMLTAFAIASIAVGQTRTAIVELIVAVGLVVGAVVVARKRRRFTDLDLV